MKLPIKKKYFDKIKSGKKPREWRDAHITFVCEETGEIYRQEIVAVHLVPKSKVPVGVSKDIQFTDEVLIEFVLE